MLEQAKFRRAERDLLAGLRATLPELPAQMHDDVSLMGWFSLDLVRRAGAEDQLLVQERLRIDYRDDRGWSTLRPPDAPWPAHEAQRARRA